jgi:hypothetical protein
MIATILTRPVAVALGRWAVGQMLIQFFTPEQVAHPNFQ